MRLEQRSPEPRRVAIRRPMKATAAPEKGGPRTNRDIRAVQVQLIDAEGKNPGVINLADAQRQAEEAGLDLVEIVPNATPPVCKILDFGKFKFQEQKKKNEARKRQKLVEVKEIGGTRPGDILLPVSVPDPNNETCPGMDPFEVYRDDLVRVTATLVDHHQVFPSLAYRFDTPDGSVVFSGDTGPDTHGNLQKLADGADILVHEVIDRAWIDQKFGTPEPGSQMAALKTHMLESHTAIDAVGAVAEDCRVKTLVLNHIVPGNTPVLHLQEAEQNFSGNLIIGKDLMQIGIGGGE